MTNTLKIALAAVLCTAGAPAALAGEGRQTQSKDGLHINYYPSSKVYCLRASSEGKAAALGLTLHSTECGTAARWAREGLTIARRGDAARQMASAR